MARRSRRPATSDAEEDVNVTPLLDIVFIMLIFFIVTSTFIKEPGPDPIRPEVATQEKQRSVAILVAITEDDEIWINKEQYDLSEVRYQVQLLRKETPKGNAVVQADKEAKSKTLIEVLQQIQDAGIDDVAVSTIQA
ncbi:MAG: biopolymer transporter ExbD [Pseudomonadota bacterium]